MLKCRYGFEHCCDTCKHGEGRHPTFCDLALGDVQCGDGCQWEKREGKTIYKCEKGDTSGCYTCKWHHEQPENRPPECDRCANQFCGRKVQDESLCNICWWEGDDE